MLVHTTASVCLVIATARVEWLVLLHTIALVCMYTSLTSFDVLGYRKPVNG